jgi:ribonuclease P/MRP protein subunit RPP40
MVSGLKGASYEEKLLELGLPTLEERRHQADMIQTFKIVRGIDRVDYTTWFQLASETGRATTSADDTLNLRPKTTRLEVRRHFFSNRVVEGWNQIPSEIKNARNVSCFKKAYKKHRVGLPTFGLLIFHRV